MKLTFLGAGGVRTPLVLQSIHHYRDRLPELDLCLMDVDGERLGLMQMVCRPWLEGSDPLSVTWTTDSRQAIHGADVVVTTFRVGGMASRVVDEQVPLRYGVIGQETTGPGGFAMALRTIPVLLDYVALIQALAPNAWLFNFSNPAGLLTEAITRLTGFERVVGICDNPSGMVRAAAGFLGVRPERLFPEYFGLNHLGWLRGLYLDGVDQVPRIVRALAAEGLRLEGMPFDPAQVAALGLLPNEYNFFYTDPRKTVENLRRSGQSRAQQIQPFNEALVAELRRLRDRQAEPAAVAAVYAGYLEQRHRTYMTIETGQPGREPAGEDPGAGATIARAAEGYTGVMLDLLTALLGEGSGAAAILNVPNRGAVAGMADEDVVEVTCFAGQGVVRPLATGPVPDHALGLMKQVKAYERLTIQAAVEGSYVRAVEALALHPLVPSFAAARAIVDDYIEQHGDYFPRLH